MHKAYIYPVTSRFKSEVHNPYIDNFINYNSTHFAFLNKNSPSNTGLFNILKFINRIDTIFFNWIEKIPEFKGGYVQSIFLILLLYFCKIKGIKIVWTLHNNISHSNKHLWLKKFIFKILMKKSDLIITHSRAGKALVVNYTDKLNHVLYFPHPIIETKINENSYIEHDILIWGSLIPYKGIDKFLEKIYENNLQDKYSIYIAGKCYDSEYLKKLTSYTNCKIVIEDQFLDNTNLLKEMSASRIVLFTYSSDSILSSGALAESVSCGKLVVGPYKAAFKDLSDLGYIFTYDDFNSLIILLDEIITGKKKLSNDRIKTFNRKYHWTEFATKLSQELN
jgi:beta-1,4-mannosyltransferase